MTLPVNAVTSFIVLFHRKSGFGFLTPLPDSISEEGYDAASQIIVIIGAGTNVGKIAIQYAKIASIGTIIGIASGSRDAELKAIGATHIIDRHLAQTEIVQKVHVAAGGVDMITHVHDCANWTYELATDILAPGKSSILLVLHPIDEAADNSIKAKKPKCEAKFVIGKSKGLGAMEEGFWKTLPVWAEKGLVLCP